VDEKRSRKQRAADASDAVLHWFASLSEERRALWLRAETDEERIEVATTEPRALEALEALVAVLNGKEPDKP
jgi:hypothetical protein